MDNDFKLTTPEVFKAKHGGPRPGSGRPRGRRNQIQAMTWRKAGIMWPSILEGMLTHAMRVSELNPPKTAVQCAMWIGERFFPEPRSAPVQIDIAQLGAGPLVAAVQAGDLTPGDAAALMRAQPRLLESPDAPEEETNAREALATRLVRAIEERQRRAPSSNGTAAVAVPEPAVAPADEDEDAALIRQLESLSSLLAKQSDR